MPTLESKRCGGCGQDKPLEEFYRLRTASDGRQKRCKVCQSGTPAQRERMRRHRRENPCLYRERRRAEALASYGLTVADFERLLLAQGGRCGSCSTPMLDDLRIDHDHRTGEVRGLLCNGCNLALGMVNDDPDRLRALAAYLA